MAMVAKQGWKLMKNPDTLVARIFKARYFPNSTLFDSHLGNNPSYAWRSIWKSRQVLLHGCRWKIGDGTRIKVMSDPWLRKEDGLWMNSPHEQGAYNLYVNNLLLPNEKKWDHTKIFSMFPLNVANLIVATPLFNSVAEDEIVWMDDIYGIYRVKSGYKLLLKANTCDTFVSGQEGWKHLWKVQAPPKTKHLLWRVCKDCLPTRERLHERFVPCPLPCPICELHNESDWHIFFECTNSIAAWQNAGLYACLQPRLQRCSIVKEVLFDICCHEEEEVAGKIAMLMWVIWNNRNNCVWNGEKEIGQQLGNKALHLWEEWRSAQNMKNRATQTVTVQQQTQWHKPNFGWFKCNVDAGFHNVERKTSLGWCVRDHEGRFVVAGTSWNDGNCSIIEGEAMALLDAMKEVVHIGLTNVIFETDSKSVVDAIHRHVNGISEFSNLIVMIKNVLSLYSNFQVKFIKRQANSVAHMLARAAVSWPRRYIFDLSPTCIDTLLANEMI